MKWSLAVALLLVAGVASAKTTAIDGGKYVGTRDEAVEVYRNVPVPPAGYIHGAMVSTIIRLYLVECDGRVYAVLPHGKNPLKMFAPGDAVTLRLDVARDRLYVILPDKKHGLAREFRYDVMETRR